MIPCKQNAFAQANSHPDPQHTNTFTHELERKKEAERHSEHNVINELFASCKHTKGLSYKHTQLQKEEGESKRNGEWQVLGRRNCE